MRRFLALTVILTAMLGTEAAVAFEQTTVPPPESGAPAAPLAADEDAPVVAQLQNPGSMPGVPLGSESAPQKSSVPVFGFGIMPKIDFGLELLYGEPQPIPQQLGMSPDQTEDVTVLGTVKHQF